MTNSELECKEAYQDGYVKGFVSGWTETQEKITSKLKDMGMTPEFINIYKARVKIQLEAKNKAMSIIYYTKYQREHGC